MNRSMGLVLVEHIPVKPGNTQDSPVQYHVSQMRNTLEWGTGQVLTRQEVAAILKRKGSAAVEVIIKEA